ncbi:hypothetical protein ACFQZC_18690 [Streptacidiphilus monticola]
MTTIWKRLPTICGPGEVHAGGTASASQVDFHSWSPRRACSAPACMSST